VSAMNRIESAAEQCDVQQRQFPVFGFEFQEEKLEVAGWLGVSEANSEQAFAKHRGVPA
jgi:hypothetical protein